MHFAAAGHPALEQLIAFTDGEAGPDVEGHVEGCGVCAGEVDSLTAVQAALRQTLYRFDCPAPHALGEYELDVVSPDQRVRIATHAAECDECALELRSMREFLAAEVSVPETIISQLRRVVATLLMPPARLGLAGVRGTDSELRQYQVSDATVSISSGAEPGSVIGLLILEDASRMYGEVRLEPSHGGPRQVTSLDELGNFEFFDLAGGEYALEIHLADEVIVIENLRVD
jgi:hypothetical protein